MNPEIKEVMGKMFVGQKLEMSLVNNKTPELWKRFMPRKKEVKHIVGVDVYSVDVYPPDFFTRFNPGQVFEKWAAVEVAELSHVPQGLETYVLPQGLYAVFHYKGLGSQASKLYQSILQEWLPTSGYSLDHRPHLAVMGEKYKNEDPSSEEEFWIPVRNHGAG